MADISQNIYDKARKIRKLLFQQQRALGDFELNELQDTWLSLLKDLQGNQASYGPVGDGFQVDAVGAANTISIRKGVFLYQDQVLFLDEDTTISGLTTPGGPRTDKVFAFATQSEKNETDFPNIVNPDNGQVMALRLAYNLTFAVSENHPSSPPSVPSGGIAITLAQLNRTASVLVSASEIEDQRYYLVQSYHDATVGATGRVTVNTGLLVDIEAATGRVAGTPFSVASGSSLVTDAATSYVYVDQTGTRVISTAYPLDQVAFEAKVVAAGGAITSITDLRQFKPQTQLALDFVDVKASVDQLRPHQQIVPDMTVYVEPGLVNYGPAALTYAGGSSPTFTAPITDPRIDLLYIDSTGALVITQGVEAVSPVPPAHDSKIPIAEVTLVPLQTTILDTDIRDVRPFINLGGSGGDSVLTRLQNVMSESVFDRAILDPLQDVADLHGSSTGTLTSPSDYTLDPGELLRTNFLVAPTGAPSAINQVGIVVLTPQEIGASDLTVEVDRGAGFETVLTFDGVSASYSFTGATGNVLNLRLTNASGSVIDIEGYGMFFQNSGGTSAVLVDGAGTTVDASQTQVSNRNPFPVFHTSGDAAYTWDAVAAGGTFSWAAGAGSTLDITYYDSLNGYMVNTISAPGSLTGVTAGSYVYLDLDPTTPGGPVANGGTFLLSAGAPPAADVNRVIFGRRVSASPADVFVTANEHIVLSSTVFAAAASSKIPSIGLNDNIYEALLSASAPTSANPFITNTALNSRSVFSVHKNGVNQSIPTGVDTKVTFSTAKFDSLSEFNTGTSRFQPTVAGKYLLASSVSMIGLSAGVQVTTSIWRNAAVEIWHGDNEVTSAGFNDPTRTVSIIVEADGVSDYFEVVINHNDGGARNVSGSASLTYFMGHRVA